MPCKPTLILTCHRALEPFRMMADTSRATEYWIRGYSRDTFKPWSRYGQHCKQRLNAGSSPGRILAVSGNEAGWNILTLGGKAYYEGAVRYARTGDPSQMQDAAAMNGMMTATIVAWRMPGAAAAEAPALSPVRFRPGRLSSAPPARTSGRVATGTIQNPGKISGNPANVRLPTGVALKNKLWWRERWYRITPEDAQAYRNATGDFQSELSKATRWLPEAERRAWHRAEMSQFRTDWLQNFLEDRSY